MSESLKRLQETWETLGTEDPLWAIHSDPAKKGNRWDLEEFLGSGNGVIDRYAALLAAQGAPARFEKVLDFGCGVGRLTLAWTRHADRVTGVDISGPMIEQGRRILAGQEAVRLELNQAENLALFPDASFDLVFSHIVLQHIPWKYAQGYLREFARVCKPGGWVAFQLPSRPLLPQTGARIRRWIVDRLPFGLGAAYRRWKHGTSVLFNMHFTPPEKVRAVLTAAGLREIHREPDRSAGNETEGFIYLYRRNG